MRLLVSPWVLPMTLVCACGVLLGVGMLILHPSLFDSVVGGPVIGVSLLIWINYARRNFFIVLRRRRLYAPWRVITRDQIDYVTIVDSSIASPVGGRNVLVHAGGQSIEGVVALTEWGGRRQARRLAKRLGVPFHDLPTAMSTPINSGPPRRMIVQDHDD